MQHKPGDMVFVRLNGKLQACPCSPDATVYEFLGGVYVFRQFEFKVKCTRCSRELISHTRPGDRLVVEKSVKASDLTKSTTMELRDGVYQVTE